MPVNKKSKPSVLLKNGVYLHASAVSVSGNALLFLGHSTAGKSTICRLLAERYPAIADDKVLVSRCPGRGWEVRDASGKFRTWTGTGYPLGRRRYPLLAVLRIFKGNTAKILPIPPSETCRYLMDAIFENDFQRNIGHARIRKGWFKMAAEISRNYEGWRLTFPKNRSILKKIQGVFAVACHCESVGRSKGSVG